MQHSTERKRHFFDNRSEEVRRSELIHRIERAVEAMSLMELEALSYDMFSKGYIENAD